MIVSVYGKTNYTETNQIHGVSSWDYDLTITEGYHYDITILAESSQKELLSEKTLTIKPMQFPFKDMGDHYIIGGDMVLFKGDTNHQSIINAIKSRCNGNDNNLMQSSKPQRSFYKKGILLWPGGAVEYCYQNTQHFSSAFKNMVRDAMDQIEKACPGVVFIEKKMTSKTQPGLRIVHIEDKSKLGSCSLGYSLAYVGDSSFFGGKLQLNESWLLDNSSFTYEEGRGVVIHELLHALGVPHEHQRPDRAHYIDVVYSNFENPDDEVNYGITPELHSVLFTEYDISSIMHYGAWAGTKHNTYTVSTMTFRPKDLSKTNIIGQRNNLSGSDIKGIRALYPFVAGNYWRDHRHDCLQTVDRRHDCLHHSQWVDRRHDCPDLIRWVDRRHDCLRWVKVKKKVEWGGHWNTKPWPWKWVKEYKTFEVDEIWNHKNDISCGIKGWPHQELQAPSVISCGHQYWPHQEVQVPSVISCGQKGWPHQEAQLVKGVISCGQEGIPHQEFVPIGTLY